MWAFDSIGAFFVMEGHGPYVWTCYGVFFLLLGGLMFWSVRQQREIRNVQRRHLERDEVREDKVAQGRPAATFTRINPS